MSKIRPGGLLIGHDYDPDRFSGVCRSVEEFAQRKQVPLVQGGHTVWLIAKPAS